MKFIAYTPRYGTEGFIKTSMIVAIEDYAEDEFLFTGIRLKNGLIIQAKESVQDLIKKLVAE